MNWLFLTLLSVFLVSFANILQRILMKGDESNPYSFAVVFHLLLGFLNLGAAFLLGGFVVPQLGGNLIYIVIASALWGCTTVFLFKSLKILEASEVTILGTSRVVVTILASVIFLKETFDVQKIIGAIIILFSIFLVTNLKKGVRFNRGTIYVFLMALFSGLAIVVDAFVVQNYNPVSYNTISNFLIALMLLLVFPKTLGQWRTFIQPKFVQKMLPLGFLSTAQAIALLYALSIGGNASQVGTIDQTAVIVTVLFSALFLKERDHLIRKIIAAFLVVGGVILLS